MPSELLPELALIPSGDFLMGADDGEPDERPAHRVHVPAFLMGVHPVTHAEYARFVQATGHRPPAVYELPLVVVAGGEARERGYRATSTSYVWANGTPPADKLHHPVTLVRWEDAASYCAWLSAETGRGFRLPAEAEWEKAARGGVPGARYPWGNSPDREKANYLADPALKAARGTTPVRTFPPNAYGLLDMVGNVWEWVRDWYDPAYYTSRPTGTIDGPAAGRFKLLRGGSWLVAEERMLRCTHRHNVPPDTYSYAIGFRVACAA